MLRGHLGEIRAGSHQLVQVAPVTADRARGQAPFETQLIEIGADQGLGIRKIHGRAGRY